MLGNLFTKLKNLITQLNNMKDLFYILLSIITLYAMLGAVISYHNRDGGYCDQAKGTAQEYNINYIICQ